MKHTEGTWKNIGERVIVPDKAGFTPTPAHPDYVIAQCHVFCSPDYEEAKSNANLMAASKDMYETLQETLTWLNNVGGNDLPGSSFAIFKIKQVLAKAEGKNG